MGWFEPAVYATRQLVAQHHKRYLNTMSRWDAGGNSVLRPAIGFCFSGDEIAGSAEARYSPPTATVRGCCMNVSQ